MDYFLYLAAGALAGLLSGLFGLGGGIIIVPVLVFLFTASGWSQDIITHLAICTSLGTIVVTSMVSIATFQQHRMIRWPIVRSLAAGIVVGAFIGGFAGSQLSGYLLQLLFGCLMVLVAAQLVFGNPARDSDLPSSGLLGGAGFMIGALSSVLGIGGGSLTVPFLTYRGVVIRQAVAVSAACGLPLALAGAAGYIISGFNSTNLPDGSIGYLFFPAWLGIVLASMPFARLGARVAHRLNERRLRQLFAGISLVLGVRFIWINSPLVLGS